MATSTIPRLVHIIYIKNAFRLTADEYHRMRGLKLTGSRLWSCECFNIQGVIIRAACIYHHIRADVFHKVMDFVMDI